MRTTDYKNAERDWKGEWKMNRSERRAANKKKPGWQKLTKDQKMAALIKNGITPKDLENSYNDGYENGRHDAITGTYQVCFAAVCQALGDLYDYDRDKLHEVLCKMQDYIIDTFTSAEAVQAVYKRFGLELDFGDPTHWVQFDDGEE